MLVTLLSLAALASASASASVSVQYPLQDQLPLIARVNEPYSWSMSRETFSSSNNASLVYSSSTLPTWLSFDNTTLTLQGTPSSTDEGTPDIRITATDPSNDDSANSSFDLCVTPYPAPQLHIPVEQQFYATNPSLSSVFLLSDKSALNYTGKPALRIPPSWSFSIGFLYDTFTNAGGDLYYDALRSDGSSLPDWVEFNPKALTFNGVTPKMTDTAQPTSVTLALHASDQEGYSAGSVTFDIVVAAHEVSMSMSSLPTINITANAPFNFSLTSPDDFSGVLLDGKPIQPEDVSSLDIDTTAYKAWLHYDSATRTLSGQAPDNSDGDDRVENPTVPVTITANVNQSISTNVSLAVVPSFFTSATLQPILVLPDHSLDYNLVQAFSNSTELGAPTKGDVNISAAFDPTSATGYLSFDPSHASLTGNIPTDAAKSYSHISVTFTAYSHITHSTSHTTLPISLSNADYAHQNVGGLSEAAKQKLLLGLKITFSVISFVITFACALAAFRRCAHVRDTALTGTEGTKAYTAEEMRWYGIGIEVDGKVTEGPTRDVEAQQGDSEKDGYGTPSVGPSGFGAALQRVLSHPRSMLSSLPSPRLPQSPGVMRKGEFMGRIRSTARTVSDKYKRSLSKRPRRPVIGKPTLVATTDHRVSARMGVPVNIDGLPFTMPPNADILPAMLEPVASHPAPIPFEDMNLSHYAPSGMSSIAGSPSSSTGGRSIPRRRADFAPPKSKAANINSAPGANGKRGSVDSVQSYTSNGSIRTHEVEAVVHTAARATSVRSGYSAASADGQKTPDMSRPRLVPFTSASRVPVPKLPVAVDQDSPVLGAAAGGAKTKRVASQVAKIFRGEKKTAAQEPSADDLNTSVNYVRALGDDVQSAASGSIDGSPTGTFSVESSQHGHDGTSIASGKIPIVPRMLARTGEQFKFRVPVSYSAGSPLTSASGSPRKQKVLEARLMNGKPLPRFVKTDLTAIAGGAGARVEKRVVEFWGMPTSRDTGEINVGIYEKESDKCVGRAIIQIVERSS